ncbi:MAG: hypothetical protein GY708_18130 [Actinomycetia bacterium]|nr:hypothetical protein [Actinomycetes bacterium]
MNSEPLSESIPRIGNDHRNDAHSTGEIDTIDHQHRHIQTCQVTVK